MLGRSAVCAAACIASTGSRTHPYAGPNCKIRTAAKRRSLSSSTLSKRWALMAEALWIDILTTRGATVQYAGRWGLCGARNEKAIGPPELESGKEVERRWPMAARCARDGAGTGKTRRWCGGWSRKSIHAVRSP